MKNKDAKWAIERIHKLTGAVYYLSPGEVNWVAVRDHQVYGTRYGRWTKEEAEKILQGDPKILCVPRNDKVFDYNIRLHAAVK